MELIKKLETRKNKTGNNKSSWGLFLCSYCLKEVEKLLNAGKRDKSCGCRKKIKKENPMYNKKHVEETKQKISNKRKGKYIGKENPNYGNGWKIAGENHYLYGKHHTEEAKQKMSEKKKGKKFTEEHKQKISKATSGENNSMYGKKGIEHPVFGYKHTEKHKQKMSKSYKGKNNPMYGKSLEKHPNWQGGKSFEPYGIEFNKQLKNFIKQRDLYICQTLSCFNVEKLDIHHIDYNKQNNNPNNLITLCKSCHMKTNFNREFNTNYYSEIVNIYL